MEITSLSFITLTILSVFVFHLLKPKYKILFLTLLSCCFIASFSYKLLIYIIVYSFLNYLIGIKLSGIQKKLLFIIGITLNLLQLVLFKYYHFTIEPVFKFFNYTSTLSNISNIIIPIGISYFTLQALGYLINIKMGWEKPEKNYLHFLLYIIFYPKFLSGPIERSNHFLPQLKKCTSFNYAQVTEGLKIALFGFFKKIVIANQLSLVVTSAHSNIESFTTLNLWIVVFLQPLYLYFDFSGYTDIAIGLAKTFGIELVPNFNKPFFSENVTNFWKRFHMSLSSWFNDYVFKQLSFRYRKWGKYASVFAVFITFTLFGIWHGAGWQFMVLGFIQAAALNYEFFTKKLRAKIFLKLPYNLRSWSGRVFTYAFFSFSLIFFFSQDIKSAVTFFVGLIDFSSDAGIGDLKFIPISIVFLILAVLFFEYIEQDQKVIHSKLVSYWSNHGYLRIGIYYLIAALILSQIGEKITFVYQMF